MMITFSVQRNGARGKQVDALVDDHLGIGRGGKDRDRLMISVHPGPAAGEDPDQSYEE
jgi:hypothetical protein